MICSKKPSVTLIVVSVAVTITVAIIFISVIRRCRSYDRQSGVGKMANTHVICSKEKNDMRLALPY
jgi:hypothetical protein